VLDTLGTLFAGSTAHGGHEVVEVTKEWGGKEESTIIAYGGKVPAPMAAFCNASMAHALDLDDTHATLAYPFWTDHGLDRSRYGGERVGKCERKRVHHLDSPRRLIRSQIG